MTLEETILHIQQAEGDTFPVKKDELIALLKSASENATLKTEVNTLLDYIEVTGTILGITHVRNMGDAIMKVAGEFGEMLWNKKKRQNFQTRIEEATISIQPITEKYGRFKK